MDIRDKTVIITGASAGIGRETALLLAKQGARLTLLARNVQKLGETEAAIRNITPNVLAIPFDVQQPDAMPGLMKTIAVRFGSIDVLINNAGVGHFGTIGKMSLADLEILFRTNVFGLVALTQAAIPYLKQSKGMVVNISSALGKRALPFLAAYSGTKSMVDAISEGLRLELKEYGIHVLNYSPPAVDTGFSDNALRSEGLPPRSEMPKRKAARVHDIGKDIVKAIRKGKRAVVRGKFLHAMNFFAPRFLDFVFYTTMVKRIKH
jgi:short-subunit dehydrogenase